METDFSRIEFHMAHSEYYKYIESFPNQRKVDEKGHLTEHQQRMDSLRSELTQLAVNPKQIENKLCYRTCFKWNDKDYIQYCLDQKCGGASFNGAAAVLGYLK